MGTAGPPAESPAAEPVPFVVDSGPHAFKGSVADLLVKKSAPAKTAPVQKKPSSNQGRLVKQRAEVKAAQAVPTPRPPAYPPPRELLRQRVPPAPAEPAGRLGPVGMRPIAPPPSAPSAAPKAVAVHPGTKPKGLKTAQRPVVPKAKVPPAVVPKLKTVPRKAMPPGEIPQRRK